MVTDNRHSGILVEDLNDPEKMAQYRAQDERHARNLRWLESHWDEIPDARGQFVAVANEQAFVAETAEKAWNWARNQNPADDGALVLLVPADQGWRIYAHRR